MHKQELRTGDQLPSIGLGTWKIDQEIAPQVVREALEVGYRHLDCACDYGNEVQVGRGIAAALADGLCRREDLWVTSKLWNTYHAPEHVRLACERSLADLGLDYLDLYLVHFPISLRYVPFEQRYPPGWFFDPAADRPRMEEAAVPIAQTWVAMEQLVTAGLVRNIGVCNFNVALLRDLLSGAVIPPAVLQVELHPQLTQQKLLRFCREKDLAVTAFSPLGAPSYVPLGMADSGESILQHPTIAAIAAACRKTPAQVILRWGLQRGTALVPKTSRSQRLRENISILDFELSPAQMKEISALNANRRFNDPGVFCEEAFNTFFPIYE